MKPAYFNKTCCRKVPRAVSGGPRGAFSLSLSLHIMAIARSLLTLRTEVVDNILSYIIQSPPPVNPKAPPRSPLRYDFRIPILQVCRRLRQQASCMIARSYIWVRVISNTPYDAKSVHWLTNQFSRLSELCTSFLPPRSTCITFEIGEINQPRPAITEVEVNRCSLLIPYQYGLFAQLCTTFWEE